MKIVSNASPLIGLVRPGKLELLHQVYGELIIPPAVWREVVIEGAGQPGADQVQAAIWIVTQTATNRQLVQALQQELDAGEAEAIALALEISADTLLMDEHLGRETASHLGLRCVGLVGVLIAAKRQGRIQTIKPHLDALRHIAGFRISNTLYARVLRGKTKRKTILNRRLIQALKLSAGGLVCVALAPGDGGSHTVGVSVGAMPRRRAGRPGGVNLYTGRPLPVKQLQGLFGAAASLRRGQP